MYRQDGDQNHKYLQYIGVTGILYKLYRLVGVQKGWFQSLWVAQKLFYRKEKSCELVYAMKTDASRNKIFFSFITRENYYSEMDSVSIISFGFYFFSEPCVDIV